MSRKILVHIPSHVTLGDTVTLLPSPSNVTCYLNCPELKIAPLSALSVSKINFIAISVGHSFPYLNYLRLRQFIYFKDLLLYL